MFEKNALNIKYHCIDLSFSRLFEDRRTACVVIELEKANIRNRAMSSSRLYVFHVNVIIGQCLMFIILRWHVSDIRKTDT